jgi:2-iminobutanoate/2-iminopropanoate deaminase
MNHPSLPAPKGAYSHVAMASGFIFTAGTGPRLPETGQVPDGIDAQTRQTLRALSQLLAAAGAGLSDVVKVTVHLADLERDFQDFDSAYRDFFPDDRPVRTTVGSELSGILVEIDVVAEAPETSA